MDFKVNTPRKDLSHVHKGDLDLAYQFTKEIYAECQTLIKAVVLFGSTARTPEGKKHHDIDMLVILDDVGVTITPQVAESYKIIAENVVARVSKRLHITTLKLSTFWEYVRAGDPIGMNILRDGVAIIDTGFFDPLQTLLKQGRIRPTPESIWQYYARAPNTLHNSRWHLLQATVDLYWAVIDAAHAVLMHYGQVPPSPDHVAALMQRVLVEDKKVLEPKYVKTMESFYQISKSIQHRQTTDISGQLYEQYYAHADAFVKRMKLILDKEI